MFIGAEAQKVNTILDRMKPNKLRHTTRASGVVGFGRIYWLVIVFRIHKFLLGAGVCALALCEEFKDHGIIPDQTMAIPIEIAPDSVANSSHCHDCEPPDRADRTSGITSQDSHRHTFGFRGIVIFSSRSCLFILEEGSAYGAD
jgi:hypothetical protein